MIPKPTLDGIYEYLLDEGKKLGIPDPLLNQISMENAANIRINFPGHTSQLELIRRVSNDSSKAFQAFRMMILRISVLLWWSPRSWPERPSSSEGGTRQDCREAQRHLAHDGSLCHSQCVAAHSGNSVSDDRHNAVVVGVRVKQQAQRNAEQADDGGK